IFTPKAFSMRSAMSPERSALPLSRLDSAGRATRSAAAAAVTDRPAGSIISVRTKSPGWGGLFIGMVLTLFEVPGYSIGWPRNTFSQAAPQKGGCESPPFRRAKFRLELNLRIKHHSG